MSGDVPVCAHILKSHPAALSLLCPFDATENNKTRHQRTGGFRQKVRTSINHKEGYLCSGNPMACHAEQQEYFYLRMWAFFFLLLSSK